MTVKGWIEKRFYFTVKGYRPLATDTLLTQNKAQFTLFTSVQKFQLKVDLV